MTHVKGAQLGDRPSVQQVQEALKKQTYAVVTLTHVDTSTGVLVDVEAMAKAIKQVSPDTLVIVDGVCSIGAETLRMDDWQVDGVLTASQKALGTPSGLCVMVFSQKAMVFILMF